MATDGYFFALLVLYALLALGGLILFWQLYRNFGNPRGRGCERKATRKLRGFARLHLCKVLSGVTLEGKDGDVPVQNMLIGPFGILLVHTCGAKGQYYGDADGESWILTTDKGKKTIPNPLADQERAVAALRDLFARTRVFKVPIESVVYISNRAKKTDVFVKHSGQILRGGRLGAYLDREKYREDRGVDAARVAEVIRQADKSASSR